MEKRCGRSCRVYAEAHLAACVWFPGDENIGSRTLHRCFGEVTATYGVYAGDALYREGRW